MRQREKHQFIVLLIDAFIGWFLYVPWPGFEPMTLVHRDNALTNWTTQPGLPFLFFMPLNYWTEPIVYLMSHLWICLIVYFFFLYCCHFTCSSTPYFLETSRLQFKLNIFVSNIHSWCYILFIASHFRWSHF